MKQSKQLFLGFGISCMAIIGAMSSINANTNLSSCKGCHGQHFEKKALGVSKVVKDMTLKQIKTALKGYKDGTFGGPMKGVMKAQVTNIKNINKTAEAVYMINHKIKITDIKLQKLTKHNSNPSKGQKFYIRKLKQICKKDGINNGGELAKKHTQEEWQTIANKGMLKNEIDKICPSVKKKDIKTKYLNYIYDFLYNFASDSGNVPSC